MERYEIEAFLTLAEELHFGRTAERLRVSTAHISRTIKKMERQVGVPLFERTSRRVVLTAVGSQLRAELRPAYDQVRQSVQNAKDAGRGIRGNLRVGYFGSAGGKFMLEAGEIFQARYPDCTVQIRELQLSDGAFRLRDGDVDLQTSCYPMEEPDMSIGPVLYTEAKMLAVPAEHPLAQRSSVSLEDLAHVKMIQNPPELPVEFDEFHHPKRTPSGRPIEPGPTGATFPEILALVGAGKGVYITTEQATKFYLRPDVIYLPIPDAPPLEFALGWLTAGRTRRIEAFVEAASENSLRRENRIATLRRAN